MAVISDDGRRYRELVDGISTVMLTTADLSARPVTVQRDDDGVTWFLVSDSAAWLDHLDEVGIAFQSTDTWVSAIGPATVGAAAWAAPGKPSALLEIGRGLVTGDKAEPGRRESLTR